MDFQEVTLLGKPLLLTGENYNYWKIRMTIFLKSLGYPVWKMVDTKYTLPLIEIAMDDKKTKEAELNSKAMNALYCALGTNEFNRVSQCTTAYEIWTTLSSTHEGTSKVKKVRLNLQRTNYEAFKLEQTKPSQRCSQG